MSTLPHNARSIASTPSTERRNRSIKPLGVLSEKLFRDALVRERKRADRYEEAFALVLIYADRRDSRPSRWERLLATLSQDMFNADLIGWFAEGAVLGFIRALDDRGPADAVAVSAAMQQELVRCLMPADADFCSIRLEIYSPRNEAIPPVIVSGPAQRPGVRELASDTAKRILDLAGSAAFLIAFSPVFLLVAAAVKLTSQGPVFFRQQRIGEAGRPFLMLKFRTMQVNADPAIHQQYVENFITSSGTSEPRANVVFKIVNDPRVTSVGHFLRRSSLDEFPQFWNVLKGEMSLVGPRPPLPYEVARYKGWHKRRLLEAKPGITGLWQVTGRSRTTFDEMVRLDLRYAQTCSIWTDVKILLATPRAVLTGKGAH